MNILFVGGRKKIKDKEIKKKSASSEEETVTSKTTKKKQLKKGLWKKHSTIPYSVPKKKHRVATNFNSMVGS